MPASTSSRNASGSWRRALTPATQGPKSLPRIDADEHGSRIKKQKIPVHLRSSAVSFFFMSGRITRRMLKLLDSAAARLLPRARERASHLVTGSKGEEDVYFHLRQHGYVMVARNWRSP